MSTAMAAQQAEISALRVQLDQLGTDSSPIAMGVNASEHSSILPRKSLSPHLPTSPFPLPPLDFWPDFVAYNAEVGPNAFIWRMVSPFPRVFLRRRWRKGRCLGVSARP